MNPELIVFFFACFNPPPSDRRPLLVLACPGPVFLRSLNKRFQVKRAPQTNREVCDLPPLTFGVLLRSRNGSVVADYQLRFLMPEEEAEQLRRFTLSREVVFNVFRQFLHDQDEERARPLYIAPDSLQMS